MTMNVLSMDGREEVRRVKQSPTKGVVADLSTTTSSHDTKKKRTWKKPKDKPMRPLSAYNMFFQNQRERIVAGKEGDPTPEEIESSVLKMLQSKTRGPKRRQDRITHNQISFGDLARKIAANWKTINPKCKAIYDHYAAKEKVRYKKEVVLWKEKKEREHDDALLLKRNSLLHSSTSLNDTVRSMSSSLATMTASLTSSFESPLDSMQHQFQRGFHGSNSGGNGNQSVEIDDDVVQRQQDILRKQMGFIGNKPHARIGTGGNDIVSRQLPNPGRLGDGSQGFRFPGDGGANGVNAMMGAKSPNPNPLLSFGESFHSPRGNQQQQHSNYQEQSLMNLQQQQLQQLRQLQEARKATSRLSNMKTCASSFFEDVESPAKLGNGRPDFPAPGQSSHAKVTMSQIMSMEQSNRAQYRQIEGITMELERLKQQERQMQHDATDQHPSTANAGLEPESMFGASMGGARTNQMNAATNYNNNNPSEFSSNGINRNNNNFSLPSIESSHRSGYDRTADGRFTESIFPVGAGAGSNNLGGQFPSLPNTFHANGMGGNGQGPLQQQQQQNHPLFAGPAGGNLGNSVNFGMSNSFHGVGRGLANDAFTPPTNLQGSFGSDGSGRGENSQIQQLRFQSRNEPMPSYLPLEDGNSNDGMQQRQTQQIQNQQRDALGGLLPIQGTKTIDPDGDLHSMFGL
mmetsp:Transcript_9139/g.21721  ORF Transcript_9139/g.21721 Transcript_9139/m.21721 type:complete len:685 (+) Transcript_9139:193-2247(+)